MLNTDNGLEIMRKKRIEAVAKCLYVQAYEAEFGGKSRGKFQITRDGVKELLGVTRLHPATVQRLTDACLNTGLVVIDMDGSFAFAESDFVSKWRKVPVSRVATYVQELNDLEDEEEEEEWD